MLGIALLLALTIPQPFTTYKPLADQRWAYCEESGFTVSAEPRQYVVNYTYCSKDNLITIDFINHHIRAASIAFFHYIDSIGKIENECGNETLLEIYEVNMEVLNNHNRFSGWQKSNPDIFEIWALFDPRNNEPQYSAIMLTKHPGYDIINFSHELAHYWANRLCLDIETSRQEMFAEDFQNYYSVQ